MIKIRKNKHLEHVRIYEMYKKAATYIDGLARTEAEISLEYVASFLEKVETSGLSFVAFENEKIIGEIHAYRIGIDCFNHMLSNLTIAVDPDFHSQGVGRKLFSTFLNEVIENHKSITRIELATRETHQRAIKFYQSMGFKIEGRFEGRVQCQDGSIVADIPMAWHRTEAKEST